MHLWSRRLQSCERLQINNWANQWFKYSNNKRKVDRFFYNYGYAFQMLHVTCHVTSKIKDNYYNKQNSDVI